MKYTLIPGESCTASEEETLSSIRSILTENAAPAKEDTRPAPAKRAVSERPSVQPKDTVAADTPRAFVERTRDAAPRRRVDDLPELEAAENATPRAGGFARIGALVKRPVASVRGFQPTTRHLALASAALLFVVRPHWFVVGSVLALLLTIGTFLTLGADRVWHGILAWLNRVEARNPARATELRGKLDRFACRWDGILDIFPDGMVDSLYMPDFQAMQQAELDHQTVVSERLDRMVQES